MSKQEQSRRILLIGPSGQVGWELRRTLSTLGRVVPCARGRGKVTIDLSQPASIRSVVRDVRPDLIVNAAAYTAVDQAEDEPEAAMAVNALAPDILAEEAARLNAAMVHYSTDYVFDGEGNQPWKENDPCNPKNIYGRSKLDGERAIQSVGIPHLILRTSWVYGARGRNFLLTMLRLAAERPELRIVDDQIGAPTWSRLIAEVTGQILAVCGASPEGIAAHSGTYHVTAAGETSWFGFARAALHSANILAGNPKPDLLPIRTDEFPAKAPRPRYSVLSNDKLKETFDLELPPWEKGLELCLDEYFEGRQNPSRRSG